MGTDCIKVPESDKSNVAIGGYKCGDTNSRACHMNLLRVEPRITMINVDGVMVAHRSWN